MRSTLRFYGDPILRGRADEIAAFDRELRDLADQLIEAMDRHNGCGLAAPQIGVASRIFVLRAIEDPEMEPAEIRALEPRVFVNPHLFQPSAQTCRDIEGCLSIPRVRGHVERPQSIQIEFWDLEGRRHVEGFCGYVARILMHENDHLNGRLFVDRIRGRERGKIESQLRALRRQHRAKTPGG